MDSKLVLVHALMLLYWESRLGDKTSSASMIEEVINNIALPEATLDTDNNRDIITGLRVTVLTLCHREDHSPIDREMLLQRLKLNIGNDANTISVVETGLIDTNDETVIQRKCIEYARILQAHVKEKNFKEMVKRNFTNILYNRQEDQLDVKKLALSLNTQLEEYLSAGSTNTVMDIDGVVGNVDFDDVDSLQGLFKEAEAEQSEAGILKTGYQAFNRMFGHHGGLRRGDFHVVGSFQHMYKTGFTLNITKQVALYNTPYMLDPKKKPMILHISSENALTDNLFLIYASLKENETSEPCNMKGIDVEEASRYIQQKMGVNGYTFKMLRVNPSEFSYRSLFQLILSYEADGYEIHLLTVDYLNMFSKAGCTQGPMGSDTRDLFRRVRNFCSARGIAVLTPHQVSTDAKYLLRGGVDLVVKELVGKSYWDSCKTLDQEIDFAVYCAIEKVEGRSYFTIARDKHRKSGQMTPERDLFTVLPFFDVGAVRDDIHSVDLSMRKPGDDLKGKSDNDDGAWFMTG